VVQELAEKEAEWEKEREALYADIGRLTSAVDVVGKKISRRVYVEKNGAG
jgi:hypothetical protein